MEINKKDLKKISRRFRQLSSRVLSAHSNELNSVIKMLIEYIDNTDIIFEYIQSILIKQPDLPEKLKEATSGYPGRTLSTGKTPEEEVSTIYQTLKFISENPSFDSYLLGWGYSSSNKYQDMAKEFGNRIVLPFVNEISAYLNDIATDMGYDEENKFMINISGGQAQVNISNDSSTLTATQNIQINHSEIEDAISELKSNISKELSDNQNIQSLLISQIELIESELKESKPKKQILKTAIDTVTSLLSTAPLAVTAVESVNKVYELISPLFS